MKVHTTNYYNTFIEVADDCPTAMGEQPLVKNDGKTVASMQYELIAKHPYQFTSDDVLFQVFAQKQDLSPSELETARAQFFSKGQPCLRASPLTKRYGWGVHSNAEGKVAVFAVGTPEYQQFVNADEIVTVKAMKSKR